MNKELLKYCKPTKINLNVLGEQYQDASSEISNDIDYNPYRMQQMQLYNPIYKRFFEMNESNFDRIALDHPFHMCDLTHVSNVTKTDIHDQNVFVKFSPLLDPYRYMVGKYDINDDKIRTLPRFDSTEETVLPKILSHNNASYVDAFFSYLSCRLLHNHNFTHGVDYYGSYMGVQDKFRVSITDDLEFLRNSSFFNENVGKLFVVEDKERIFDGLDTIGGSRRNKNKLCLEDADELSIDCDILSDIESIDETNITDDVAEVVYTKNTSASRSCSSSSSSDSELNYSSDDDSNEEDEEDEDEEDDEDSCEYSESTMDDDDEDEMYGYIHNFPMQMICMEKCDGTLDELFVNDEVTVENGASYLFQTVMILLVYQKAFQFTHNDLHTNNIMYTNTDKPFLYYKFAGKSYKVPTHGRIMKMIDFGRGIYKYQGKTFCSDSFGPDGDAATQYNIEPFMNKNRPRLEPNNSFDLCRLGSSMFDFVMEIDTPDSELDELQKTVRRWCMDDNGKNILYKKNGDERYPSFKLYKMIARTVHNHTPEVQLEDQYFAQFCSEFNEEDGKESVLDIDQIPCYV